jgi:hypothetical protein
MPNLPISQLPASNTLTGSELFAIVQDGITKQTTLDNIVLAPGNSYGLYAQTANSTIITNTTSELSLINGGVGTLSVPANGFQIGDSFRGDFGGQMSARNNSTIRIRIKTGAVILADSGPQTMPTTADAVWSLSINFTIRALGAAGVASIVALGNFIHVKQSNNTSEGFGFNTVNSSSFDTTIQNTLDVTAQWGAADSGNSIYSDIFVLNKIY